MNRQSINVLCPYFEAKILSLDNGIFNRVTPDGPKSAYRFYEMSRPGTSTKCHLWFIVQKDSFRIYGSWSLVGEIPMNYAPMHHPVDIPEFGMKRDEPLNGAIMFNAPLLWKERRPRGWIIEGMDEDVVLREIDSAVEKVRQYVIPYFREILATR